MSVRSFASNVSATVVVLSIFWGPAYACDFPGPISIPDGKTATDGQMRAAGLVLEDYIDQLQTFAECVESETGTIRRSAYREDMSAHKRREDRAAKRMNQAAAAIEEAVETYNQAMADYMLRSR